MGSRNFPEDSISPDSAITCVSPCVVIAGTVTPGLTSTLGAQLTAICLRKWNRLLLVSLENWSTSVPMTDWVRVPNGCRAQSGLPGTSLTRWHSGATVPTRQHEDGRSWSAKKRDLLFMTFLRLVGHTTLTIRIKVNSFVNT